MDEDEWEAVDIAVVPSGMSTVSFRLPTENFHALEQSASSAAQSLTDYILAALHEYERRQPTTVTLHVHTYMDEKTHHYIYPPAWAANRHMMKM